MKKFSKQFLLCVFKLCVCVSNYVNKTHFFDLVIKFFSTYRFLFALFHFLLKYFALHFFSSRLIVSSYPLIHDMELSTAVLLYVFVIYEIFPSLATDRMVETWRSKEKPKAVDHFKAILLNREPNNVLQPDGSIQSWIQRETE